jgi:hypothetical protein
VKRRRHTADHPPLAGVPPEVPLRLGASLRVIVNPWPSAAAFGCLAPGSTDIGVLTRRYGTPPLHRRVAAGGTFRSRVPYRSPDPLMRRSSAMSPTTVSPGAPRTARAWPRLGRPAVPARLAGAVPRQAHGACRGARAPRTRGVGLRPRDGRGGRVPQPRDPSQPARAPRARARRWPRRIGDVPVSGEVTHEKWTRALAQIAHKNW